MTPRVVVLGATGVFGSRIATRLAHDARFELLLAGRHKASLEALRAAIGDARVRVHALDTASADFPAALAALEPHLVIHAAGPFQGQDYRVAEACIDAGSDYIDLADGRDFVCGFSRLNERARCAGRLLVSGASSVPALSSAAVDALLPRFGRLDAIEHAINPGNRTPRGDATVASILGYCGRPIRVWRRKERTRESTIAPALEAATDRFPAVSVGSYPTFQADGPVVEVVLKSSELGQFEAAVDFLDSELDRLT